jgi:hypothetical protein
MRTMHIGSPACGLTQPMRRRIKQRSRRSRDGRGKMLAGAIGALSLATLSAPVVSRMVFDRRISAEATGLLAANRDTTPDIVAEDELAGLPEPVQRWLRWAGVVGRPRAATVRLLQEGEFRLGEERSWMPYTAEQHFTTDPHGVICRASFRMAPLLSIHGRDLYRDGIGDIDMRALSLIPVAHKHGGMLDQGALLRYLGEIIWFPSAALRPYMTWEAVDASASRATMAYGNVIASATFFFDEQGRPVNLLAVRNNDARGKPELWSIPMTDHGEFDGICVPVAGAGKWTYETGDFTYIHWRVTDIQYNRQDTTYGRGKRGPS